MHRAGKYLAKVMHVVRVNIRIARAQTDAETKNSVLRKMFALSNQSLGTSLQENIGL